jgi:peptidoglycan/xylan/chitin deacetylase (PgdA/CDA1 family)
MLEIARLALAAASPAGERARLSVLIYHRVRAQPDPLFPGEVDATRFDRQLGIVSRLFTVLRLDEAVRRLADGSLPARAASITFDDGYADNADVALPLLQKYDLPATFFISSSFIDGGRMWNDTIIESVRAAPGDTLDLTPLGLRAFNIDGVEARRSTIYEIIASLKYMDPSERRERCAALQQLAKADLADNAMLRAEQVRALHDAGMGIGAHTASHPILSRLPPAAARREISDGKAALEDMIGAKVRLFAYPNGAPGVDYGREHVDMVRALGFDAAFSTSWGAARRATDPHQLPRFMPWERTPGRIAIRFLRNLSTPIKTV